MAGRLFERGALVTWIFLSGCLVKQVSSFASNCVVPTLPRSAIRVLLQSHRDNEDDVHFDSSTGKNRRTLLKHLSLVGFSPWILSNGAMATDDVPKITQKVAMDVRISRSDGTFYVRDDLPDTPENKVFYGRLVLGLFGTTAPQHVEQFLSYVNVDYNPMDDNPLPSYGRSSFKSLDQSTGLLVGGTIPGLELTSLGGGTAMQYGGRILRAPVWIEKGGSTISHSIRGLLTHRTLDLLPSFGVTTRSCPELDATHVVFGKVIMNESSKEFFNLIQEIPTYGEKLAPPLPMDENAAVKDVAASVFNTQREFFRSAAKSFGDSRLNKVYEGKLLRRIEVTKVGLI